MTTNEVMLAVIFTSFACWAVGFGYLLAWPPSKWRSNR